jgi:hypothetical protein
MIEPRDARTTYMAAAARYDHAEPEDCPVEMTCDFCRCEATESDWEDWVPSYWEGDKECGPVCPECAAFNLRIVDGEWEIVEDEPDGFAHCLDLVRRLEAAIQRHNDRCIHSSPAWGMARRRKWLERMERRLR